MFVVTTFLILSMRKINKNSVLKSFIETYLEYTTEMKSVFYIPFRYIL